jgi:hypothetical protein
MRYKIINLASSLRWSGMAVIGAVLIMTLATSAWGQMSVVVGSPATTASLATSPAAAAAPSTLPLGLVFLGSQDNAAPNGMYGHCGNVNSGIQSKASTIPASAANLNKVAAIRVLDCHPFDGSGGGTVVPCPAGTNPVPTYCVQVQNDGLGNHVLLGVFINQNLPCQLTGKSSGPPAQITITFTDNAFGIQGVELRGGATNATTQFFAGSLNNVIVLSATKINQGAPASVSGIIVTNTRGLQATCSFNF